MTASYDKPALPHFTGRGDLEASLGRNGGIRDHYGRWWFCMDLYLKANKRRLRAIVRTLATADTPPEEMR